MMDIHEALMMIPMKRLSWSACQTVVMLFSHGLLQLCRLHYVPPLERFRSEEDLVEDAEDSGMRHHGVHGAMIERNREGVRRSTTTKRMELQLKMPMMMTMMIVMVMMMLTVLITLLMMMTMMRMRMRMRMRMGMRMGLMMVMMVMMVMVVMVTVILMAVGTAMMVASMAEEQEEEEEEEEDDNDDDTADGQNARSNVLRTTLS